MAALTEMHYSRPTERLYQRMVGLPKEMWNDVDFIATKSREQGTDSQANHNSVIFCLVGLALRVLAGMENEREAGQTVEVAINPDEDKLCVRAVDSNGDCPGQAVEQSALAEQRAADKKRGKRSKKVYENKEEKEE